jgi:glycolate oxidase
VLRVRVATIEGEIIELGSEALDAPGLDLLAVFIGSEGMLGLATEVTLRLIPRPQLARVVMASFPSIELAAQGVARIIADGVILAGLELMDKRSIHMVEPFVHAGYDMDAAAILLCESDGTPEEVVEEIERVEALLHDVGATRLQTSSSEAERLKFWAGRKNAFPAAGRISPDYYCMDGTVPRRRLAEVLRAIAAMEKQFGLRCANVFHAGDGNLHPMILFDGNLADEVDRAQAFGAAILELCIEAGGTITGEHGVGIEKIEQMCIQFSRAELDAFAAVKRAFDPCGLLNPQKVIPTHARCADYGKLHVNRGDVPFPEIPRI